MKIKIPKKTLYFVAVIIVLILAFRIGRTSQPSVRTPIVTPGTSPIITSSPSVQTNNTNAVREINVLAKQFEFTPNPIRVRLGETVKLNLSTTDVTHGFSLPEFGINEIVSPGQVSSVEFQATKKGSFPFACSVACGSGHSGMRGVLIVE